MEMYAKISRCDTYRYRLDRRWSDAPPICFVMLNPSTADDVSDDPTIRRCVGFAKKYGHGGLRVVNLFALRATDPAELLSHPDPIGPQNEEELAAAADFSMIVAAWGAPKSRMIFERAIRVASTFGDRMSALGVTKGGHPRHPLYLHASAELRAWQYAINEVTR